MTQKEEIALLKATIEELKARIVALEARPIQPTPLQPASPPWSPPPYPIYPTITWGGSANGGPQITQAWNHAEAR